MKPAPPRGGLPRARARATERTGGGSPAHSFGIPGAAHARGQRVGFRATPDTAGPARDALWAELLAVGVDHLNTDDLAGLEAFLDAHPSV
ncbi:hypothetical protein [Streptomyces sp. NPDC014793]|uniref:hypothetical protein n=1 Tax=Streptomyces sp. NPDC014793 TaxID=3364914 RepID=UPI0036FA26CF